MTMDLPIFAQATVDQTDLFNRKLSIYLRGQIGKFNYRVIASDPFPISTSASHLFLFLPITPLLPEILIQNSFRVFSCGISPGTQSAFATRLILSRNSLSPGLTRVVIFAKRGIGQRQRGRADGVGGENLGNWSGCLAISSAWRICAGLWVRRPSARARDASLRRSA